MPKPAILCVDDEPRILNSLKRLLRQEPCEVLTATSGAEGLAILEEHSVCAVVSDQMMPGMLGTEFLRRVKELHADVDCYMVTGFAEAESLEEALESGNVLRVFRKPWNNDELLEAIRSSLQEAAR